MNLTLYGGIYKFIRKKKIYFFFYFKNMEQLFPTYIIILYFIKKYMYYNPYLLIKKIFVVMYGKYMFLVITL